MGGGQRRRVVVIEAGSKQAYIFATNKRREAVGASELVHRVGTQWVDKALANENGAAPGVEVVVRSSGTATLLVPDEPTGRAVIESVTLQALTQANGLDVYGYVSPEVELDGADSLRNALSQAFGRLAEVRARRPGPASRHLRLPIVAECGSSGLPAAGWWSESRDEAPEPRARESLDKIGAADSALERFAEKLGLELNVLRTAVRSLGDETDWVAVVHADGNGLGKLFAEFNAGTDGLGEHIRTLRRFSEALDACTTAALKAALEEVFGSVGKASGRVLPLIVGGDDLTLLCSGRDALQLAERYLLAFEDKTAGNRDIRSVTERMLSRCGLTAAAGVAVVKPHFPFSSAYELAEELCGSAKSLVRTLAGQPGNGGGRHVSALDFHVVFDSSPSDFAVHRALGDGASAVMRPLIVDGSDGDAPEPGSVAHLRRVAEVLRRRSDEGGLSRSVWHSIRNALATSADAADQLYRQRKAERGIDDNELLGPSIFFGDGNGGKRTALVDALTLVDLEPGETAEIDESQEAGRKP